MARGRFLSKTISLDATVSKLSGPMVQLLWTWMIPHIDAAGRFYGEASIVRGLVFPRQQASTEEVDGYLDEMHEAGLLVRYQVDGEQYLYFPNFAKHQVGLRASREAASAIPPWDGETPPEDKDDAGALSEKIQINDGTIPEEIPPNVKNKSKVKVKISKEKEEEKESEIDFLSQTPKSNRERIRDILIDILADGMMPETDYLLRPFDDGVDALVTEFRKIWDKKRLTDDLTSKILAAVRAAYEDEANWQFNNATAPNRAVIGRIVAQGHTDKDAKAQRVADHATASDRNRRAMVALAACQAQAKKRDPWWDEKLSELALQITVPTFDSWLKDTTLLERADGRIVVGVANEYAKDWLENRLLSVVKRTVAADGVGEVIFEVMK